MEKSSRRQQSTSEKTQVPEKKVQKSTNLQSHQNLQRRQTQRIEADQESNNPAQTYPQVPYPNFQPNFGFPYQYPYYYSAPYSTHANSGLSLNYTREKMSNTTQNYGNKEQNDDIEYHEFDEEEEEEEDLNEILSEIDNEISMVNSHLSVLYQRRLNILSRIDPNLTQKYGYPYDYEFDPYYYYYGGYGNGEAENDSDDYDYEEDEEIAQSSENVTSKSPQGGFSPGKAPAKPAAKKQQGKQTTCYRGSPKNYWNQYLY
ncbi:hypothetical protein TRFO_01368 [Tritrichomonas foetus]|uniref:Uncharacterized protein n=1 Tax=Tritrichomonas foetus TaxID=1144522 RepID=A0A1J4K8J8_9EUKA|nr:hypothetical protein TRFO_01368 [Tritrichomonas foetus]|eukprot:OHT07208.1 hypothetical protein TRFO_01368 [Tritrichomonas foetus]